MELADPRLIAQLTETYNEKETRRSTRPRMTKNDDPAVYEAPRHRSRLCKCGKCSTCLDNARWERIFREKFADPTYYSRDMLIRFSSPLHM